MNNIATVPAPNGGEVAFRFTREPGGPARVTLTGTVRVNRTDLSIHAFQAHWDAATVEVRFRDRKTVVQPGSVTHGQAQAIINQVWAAAHTDPTIDAGTLADAGAFKDAQSGHGTQLSTRLAEDLECALQGIVRLLQTRHARTLILSGVPARDVDPTPPISADDLLAELRTAVEWATAPAEHKWDVLIEDLQFVQVVAVDAHSAETAVARLHPDAEVRSSRNRATAE